MPELVFKGKEYVYNHHLSVPMRPLVPDPKKSLKGEGADENLIIHGDNLHALKALLPRYAGKVDCIFIDPPYNTGNEGWSYNDNVNSPILKEWLSSNPVNKDDMLRHDKWLCLMWPRFKLLHELLSDRGSLWMTLDDNEAHHARDVLDEVFGEQSFVTQVEWQKRTSRENRAAFSPSVDHLLVYSKGLADTWRLTRNLLPKEEGGLSNPDKDPRGPWASIPFSAQGYRSNQDYVIVSPTGVELLPPKGRCWGAVEREFDELKAANLVYWPRDGNGRPRIKQFPTPDDGLVPNTLWLAEEVGDTEESKKQLMSIFSESSQLPIHAPKPLDVVRRCIQLATNTKSIVLDSFAGSGVTAHAVLAQNRRDGGNRRFILVEVEEYSDSLTAERVRRVASGYAFVGTRKEELLREKLTWTQLKQAEELLKRVESFENLDGHRFDKIRKEVEDGELVVTGETAITETMPGLGGGFTYCTLGEPLDPERILAGEAMPSFASLGAWLFHTATGHPLDPKSIKEKTGYLGESPQHHVWLIYRPDAAFMQSPAAALTLARAEEIGAAKPGKRHLVFAAAKFVSQRRLLELGVEYAPLPFTVFRVEA
ncbi:MAG TPA: DNA methyltransferase [Solimonas sp.]|nr:DNA methyltransferase [Solimonas sp.]